MLYSVRVRQRASVGNPLHMQYVASVCHRQVRRLALSEPACDLPSAYSSFENKKGGVAIGNDSVTGRVRPSTSNISQLSRSMSKEAV
jgi:hypothetical protein